MGTDTSGDLGSILGIWAHPDDEAYLSAGLMAHANDAGARVVCVTATKGEAGFPADDPRPIAERMALRQRELAACLAILNVTEHRFLGFADGGCADVPDDEVVDILAPLISELKPDTVLTFGPDGGTGHPDHIAACRWATLAFDRAAVPGTRLLYSTRSRPWVDRYFGGVDRRQIMMVDDLEPEALDPAELAVQFSCDDALLTRKLAALRAQASQVEPFLNMIGLEVYRELLREESFRERRSTDRPVTLPPRAG